MTKKERAKIYRQAAEAIFDKKHIERGCQRYGICRVFKKHLSKSYDIYNGCEKFPELNLFEIPIQAYRWKTTDEDDNKRILALLLSEQIALNP